MSRSSFIAIIFIGAGVILNGINFIVHASNHYYQECAK